MLATFCTRSADENAATLSCRFDLSDAAIGFFFH